MNNFRLHITSSKDLSLGEFREVLEVVDLAINDIKRNQGIINTKVNKGVNATLITNVEHGSIIIDFLIGVGINVVSGLIINYIQKRINKLKSDKIKLKKGSGDNDVDIHIDN